MKRQDKSGYSYVASPKEGETYFALQSQVTNEYNGMDARPTKDLTKAALFPLKIMLANVERFLPNFKFVAVTITTNGQRVLNKAG